MSIDTIGPESLGRFEQDVPVLFSGLTATSKTFYSKLIASELERPWFDATSELIGLANVSASDGDCSIWATDASRQICQARESGQLDTKLDELIMRKIEERPKSVVDAWASPWLWSQDAVRVFVTADDETRVQRCLATYPPSTNPTVADARELITRKDTYTREMFLNLYGFDLFSDHDIFDIVLDTSGYIPDTPEQTGQEIARDRILPIAKAAINHALTGNSGDESATDQLQRGIAEGVITIDLLVGDFEATSVALQD